MQCATSVRDLHLLSAQPEPIGCLPQMIVLKKLYNLTPTVAQLEVIEGPLSGDSCCCRIGMVTFRGVIQRFLLSHVWRLRTLQGGAQVGSHFLKCAFILLRAVMRNGHQPGRQREIGS